MDNVNNRQVQIVKHNGEIAAKIPYELTDTVNRLKIGRFDKSWGAWRFPYGPYTAFQLLYHLKSQIKACDPSIKELAASYYKAHQKKESSEDFPDVPKLKTIPWHHQKRVYHFCKDFPATALSVCMGGGKSLVALALLLNRDCDKNLIICPKSVIPVWPMEFEKHTYCVAHFSTPTKGTVKKRAEKAKQDLDMAKVRKLPYILVVNYESAWREEFAKFILSLEWDHIIFDELHRLKDPSSKTSKFAHKLVGNSKFRLGLTGTLLPHSPLDAFSQFKALSPDVFGKHFTHFKKRYAEMGGYGGKEVIGFKNLEDLHERIESISIRITEDVLDLPEAIHSYRLAELSTKTRKLYERLNSDLFAQVENDQITVANAMVKVLRLQQLTSGYLKTDEGELIEYGTEKQEVFRELLTEIPRDESIVIFCRFTADIANVKQACMADNRTCGELSGKLNQLKLFQDGEYDCLAVQIKSGGTGIDLTRASIGVYYSIGHSLGDYLQSLKRLHRPGQTRPVRYFHLLCKDTVDETVYKALQSKQKIVDYILDDIKQTLNQPEEKGKEYVNV